MIAGPDGTRLYWRLDGADDRPILVLLNSIGTDHHLWDAAAPHLLPVFRLLRMDMRGHGASDAPQGDYSLPMLADDVAAVMNAARVDTAAIVGVSLGGMVAMQLALDHPDRVSGLALVCTSAQMDPAGWEARVAMVRESGTRAIVDLAIGRLLSPSFAINRPEIVGSLQHDLIGQADAGYAGACAAIRDMDLGGRIGAIAVPTLVVTGERDVSTPYAGHGDRLMAQIAGAVHTSLPSAHLPPLEIPAQLAAIIRRFFAGGAGVDNAAATLFEAGLRNRRRVLGDAWVDASLAARTPFNADFQAVITRIAWQEVWSRPGLDDRTRRLLVLAITASLGRWEEFELHVRAGLSQDGFTCDELKETLMQTAIYAGVPAANTGFTKAQTIIADLECDLNG